MKNPFPRFVRAFALLLAGGVAAAGHAYSVTPLRMILEPVGAGAAGRLEVRNTEARPITLSAEAETAAVSNDGSIAAAPAGDDLLVFPPQLVVAPGQTQVIQVRYMGEPMLDGARMFAVRVTQEPVDMQTGKEAALKVGVNFITSVLVQPKGAVAVPVVTGFQPQGTALAIRVRNDGKGAVRLQELRFDVKAADGTAVAAAGEAKPVGASGTLMPGAERQLVLPLAGNAAGVKAVTASLPAD